MCDFDPILMKVLDTNLVSPHVVSTESLHPKVVNESILLQVLNIYKIVMGLLLLAAICSVVVSLGIKRKATEKRLPLSCPSLRGEYTRSKLPTLILLSQSLDL